jgi:hypothetical protein
MIRKYSTLLIGLGMIFFNFWTLFVFLPMLWSTSHVFLFLIISMTVTSLVLMGIGVLELIALFTNQNSSFDIIFNWIMRIKRGKI